MTTAVTRIASNGHKETRRNQARHQAEAGGEGKTMTRSGSLMQPAEDAKRIMETMTDDIQFNAASHVPRIATLNISNENRARQVMSGRAISPMEQ